jgi:hypothetical protein
MHGFIQLGVTALLALDNTPWPAPYKHNYVIPSLEWRLSPAPLIFVGGQVSSRCDPVEWNRFNPKTALWDVHAGVTFSGVTATVGHVSEHGIDKIQAMTESRDYLTVSYKVTF